MSKVVVVGWKPDFPKITVIEIIRKHTGYSLSQAKASLDAILENEEVAFVVDPDTADRLKAELRAVGLLVRE